MKTITFRHDLPGESDTKEKTIHRAAQQRRMVPKRPGIRDRPHCVTAEVTQSEEEKSSKRGGVARGNQEKNLKLGEREGLVGQET